MLVHKTSDAKHLMQVLTVESSCLRGTAVPLQQSPSIPSLPQPISTLSPAAPSFAGDGWSAACERSPPGARSAAVSSLRKLRTMTTKVRGSYCLNLEDLVPPVACSMISAHCGEARYCHFNMLQIIESRKTTVGDGVAQCVPTRCGVWPNGNFR